MTRFGNPSPRPKQALIALTSVLLVLSMLPANAMPFARWVGDLIETAVAPVSQPIRWFGTWIAPARLEPDPAEIQRLDRENESLRVTRDRLSRRIESLERTIRTLQGGIDALPPGSARLLEAPVTGRSSDLTSGVLTVRAGRSQGITLDTIAAVAGDDYQIVGRVIDIGPMIARVRPVNADEAETIRGRIVLREEDGWGPFASLSPIGDRRLRGPVEVPEDQPSGLPVEEGMRLRLDDPAWPNVAQGLLIGRVTEVSADEDDPQRMIVTVEPDLRLDRIGSVVLRIPVVEGIDVSGEGGS